MQVVNRLAEVLGQEHARLCPQVKAGMDAERVHARRRLRADAVELGHGQALDEARPHARRDDEQPVGLAVVRRKLGQKLVVGHPGGGGQAGFGADGRAYLGGDGGG